MKWRCKVCGYIHEGDRPPLECPLCGVGPDEFEQVDEPAPKAITAKRWKCVVCDYIHTGDNPPDVCPLCGVGPDKFVLLEDVQRAMLTAETISDTTEGTIRSALDKVSYGLYILTSHKGDAINGQCINTAFQLTDQPLRLAVSLNKSNLTHEYVIDSGVFAISILSADDIEMVRRFGYKSGRVVDKFDGVEYVVGKTGSPILKESLAFLECEILRDKIVDVGTHTLFVADVINGRVLRDVSCLTYEYYRSCKNK
ncbi:MAG: hrb [Anaerosporomusa subterranea]|jgi:flavin reductase (DIM6/NTAB) family NADH-FMN oxidoreductase RutF/rubredoxin|nr:hrb [Anaerosporomusa subterranea]